MDMMFPSEGYEYPYPEAGYSIYPAPQEPPGVEHATYNTHKVGNQEHGNRILFACYGNRLSVDDRGRTDAGRSLRSSPGTGKPSAWRREAGDRLAFEDGGYLWTQM